MMNLSPIKLILRLAVTEMNASKAFMKEIPFRYSQTL